MKLPERLIRIFDHPVDDILAAMPDLSHRAWDANPYRQNTHKVRGQTRSLIFDWMPDAWLPVVTNANVKFYIDDVPHHLEAGVAYEFDKRSPYAKVISWTNMRLTYGQYRDGSGAMRAGYDQIRAYLDQSFENGRVLDCRNIDRYRGADGRISVELMRYATLNKEFDAFVRSLGMATPPLPHAKMGLLSGGLNARDVLRPDQIARINSLFAEEFDAFGYERL